MTISLTMSSTPFLVVSIVNSWMTSVDEEELAVLV